MKKGVTIDRCKKCGQKRRIVNKYFYLCNYCNNIRLNKKLNPISIWNKKIASKLRQVSKKEINRKQLLSQVYAEIDAERSHWCHGCGSSEYPLSHSHLIPRSKRKDLEAVKENIVFDCLSIGDHKGCHDKWEGRNGKELMELKDIHRRMRYIKDTDSAYYQFLFEKIKPFIK